MAEQQQNRPLFGLNIDPSANNLQLAYNLAQIADSTRLDFLGIQDHPYNGRFLDTWTLLTALGSHTQHVRLLPNVLNLPLRPPALLAKAAATLDNGRRLTLAAMRVSGASRLSGPHGCVGLFADVWARSGPRSRVISRWKATSAWSASAERSSS